MEELRPNAQRGKLAIASIWAMICANLISMLLGFLMSFIVLQITRGSDYDMTDYYYAVFYITRFISFVYLAVLITSIVMIIRWFRRAYYNLNVLTNESAYDDSWATKAWFVPFLNLYRPYEIMKELIEKTDSYIIEKYVLAGNDDFSREYLNTGTVKKWWTVNMILVGIYSFQIFLSVIGAISILGIVGGTVLSLIKIGLMIISGIMLISIIKNYQKAENLLFQSSTIK